MPTRLIALFQATISHDSRSIVELFSFRRRGTVISSANVIPGLVRLVVILLHLVSPPYIRRKAAKQLSMCASTTSRNNPVYPFQGNLLAMYELVATLNLRWHVKLGIVRLQSIFINYPCNPLPHGGGGNL